MSLDTDNQDDSVKFALADRLKRCATEKGWKQAELARRSGLDRQLIGSYWHGKTRPSRDNLIALADALEVDPRWLAGGVNGTASRLLDRIDQLIEAGDDAAVNALRPELEGIAHDPDLEAALQNRADFILSTMGDRAAMGRRSTFVRKFETTRADARRIIADALSQAEYEMKCDLGEGLRTAILSLSGQLLFMKAEDVAPDLMNWSYNGLVEAIISRFQDDR